MKNQEKDIHVTRDLPCLPSMACKEHALSVEQSWFQLHQSHSSLALPMKVKMGISNERGKHPVRGLFP